MRLFTPNTLDGARCRSFGCKGPGTRFSYKLTRRRAPSDPTVSTVGVMADLPFGFSPGGPRQTREKDPDSGSNPSDPFAAFGMSGDFGMGDLGQIFTQLGQMFSSAGTVGPGGTASGPVNYELARRVASNSIGFVAPVPDTTNSAIADAVHLAETWLNGATALPRAPPRRWGGPGRLGRQHPSDLEAAV